MPVRRKWGSLAPLLTLVLVLALLASWLVGRHEQGARFTRAAAPLTYGMSLSTALYGDELVLQQEVAGIAASGATLVRVDFDWSVVEPQPGRFDWHYLDRLVALTQEHGLAVLAVIDYTPGWARATGTSSHSPPLDPTDLGRFAAAATARYRSDGVHTWEIWNEPNISRFWEPRPDPDRYAAVLSAATTAIRRVDPHAYILSGGLSPVAGSGDEHQLPPTRFLAAVYRAGGMTGVDAVAMHPYTFPGRPSDLGSAFRRLADLREVMQRHGDDDPRVWVTEFGAPTGTGTGAVTEQEQAQILADACVQAQRRTWIVAFVVYQLADGGTDQRDIEQNFGLRRHDQSPKPAWQSWLSCRD